MRTPSIALAGLLLFCGICMNGFSSDAGPTEEDYKNLEQLRSKLVRMRHEMDKFMTDIMSAYPSGEGAIAAGVAQDIKVDVSESDKYVFIRADMPGMDKNNIEITLTDNKILKLSGSREVMKEEKAPGIVRQERTVGRSERTITLPVECMTKGIDATYKNGVLDVMIPKKLNAKEETIKINVK